MSNTDFIVGGYTTQTFSDQVSDATSNKEMPMIARYTIDGELIWLRVVQDTEYNLATGITMVFYTDNIVFATGAYENEDSAAVFY